jgi:steroid delta-isomerase-like uncharacterized protein
VTVDLDLPEANKAIIRRHYAELWSQGNLAVADDYVAVDRIDHNSPPGIPPGRAGLKQFVAMMHRAFAPEFTPDALVAEGDLVVGRWTMRGIHRGPFMGIPPTGRPIVMTGVDVFRIVDGQMVEIWHYEDTLGLLKQLGAGVAARALELALTPVRMVGQRLGVGGERGAGR